MKKLQFEDYSSSGAWLIENSSAPRAGFASMTSVQALPQVDASELRSEEGVFGYSTTYQDLADVARNRLRHVLVSPTGVQIDGYPSASLGASGFDASIGWWCTQTNDRAAEIGRLLDDLHVMPDITKSKVNASYSSVFPADKAVILMRAVYGLPFEESDITEAVDQSIMVGLPGYGQDDLVFSANTVLIPKQVAGEVALAISYSPGSPNGYPFGTGGSTGLDNGDTPGRLYVRAKVPSGHHPIIRLVVMGALARSGVPLVSWASAFNYVALVQGYTFGRSMLADAKAVDPTMDFATPRTTWEAHEGRNGFFTWVDVAGVSVPSFMQFGPYRWAKQRVFAFPPLLDSIIVTGPTTVDSVRRVIATDQQTVTYRWRGLKLAPLVPSLTTQEVSNLKHIVAESCFNMKGVWRTPSECYKRLELAAEFAAAGEDLGTMQYSEPDASGTPALTFAEASAKASDRVQGLVHKIVHSAAEAYLLRITYTGTLAGGYSYLTSMVDGSNPSVDLDVIREAVYLGGRETNSSDTSLEAVRLACFGVTQAEVDNFKQVARKTSRELDETKMFDGRVPDPSTLPENCRAGFAIISHSPSRSPFDSVVGSQMILSRALQRRVVYPNELVTGAVAG